MELKILLSAIATAIAIISFVPYIRDMRRGRTKPHPFSWFIWATIAYIAGFGQLADGGGVGALAILVTASVCLWIAYYAFTHRAVTITRSDRLSLTITLAAIPLWIITRDPLLSVIVVSVIDLVAFAITMRKSYYLPHSENLSQYTLSIAKYGLSILALQHYSAVTLIYPVLQLAATIAFCSLVVLRRQQIAPPAA